MTISGFQLWLVFVVLYLLESIRITTPTAVIFRRNAFSGKWSGLHPFTYPGAYRYGWMLANLIPGVFPDIVLQDFLLAADADRLAPNPAMVSSKGTSLRYDEIQAVGADDRFLTINGSKYLYCESNADAETLRAFVDQLIPGPREQRARILAGHVEGQLKTGMKRRVEVTIAQTSTVRRLSGVLWCLLIVILPLGLFVTGNDGVLIPVGVLAWAISASILVAAIAARKRMSPAGGFPWNLLRYLVYPVAALRAADDLVKDCVSGVHPLSFGVEVCTQTPDVPLLRTIYLRVLYPVALSKSPDAECREVSAYWNGLVSTRFKEVLPKRAPAVMISCSPERGGADYLSWCPRCLSKYRMKSGMCADCPGVALHLFELSPGGK